MSYQVLARKWRPKNFQQMVGQEHILRMLANALDQQRIHHAYLFTGTRGVGKTTIARIFSKCLNCETGITSTPCGTCNTCTAIDAGQFLDLYEIDAASRTKVEDTREILDNVLYPPTQGRYKVYLIDEVHMLSNHSFNALLKTLEEPPEHVKFILATTDPKKLPITILSRCLQFHLKRITPELIAKHLAAICATENITHETTALDKLAHAADGSMRDALSLLDQAIAYGQGNVAQADIHHMLGSMAQDDLIPLATALGQQDGKALFEQINQLNERTPDFHQVLEELISLFHQTALAQIVPELPTSDTISQLARTFSAQDVQLYYQIALLGRRDLALSPTPQQGFEMTMLRMLAFKPGSPTTTVATKPSTNMTTQPAPQTQASSPVVSSSAQPTTTPITTGSVEWRDLLPKLGLGGMSYALASNCSLETLDDQRITFTLSRQHEPMLTAKLKERIEDAINQTLGKKRQLDIRIVGTAASELNTPVKQTQIENNQKLTHAKQAAADNPQLQRFIEAFDATMEVSLL